LVKKNKSDAYQYKIIEISVDPLILNDFANNEGLGNKINHLRYSEEFCELRQKLIEELHRIIDKDLTKRQAEVLGLRLKNLTQTEIAESLGIHQTTVHKLLNGNIDYVNGKKRYGGAMKKLKKICMTNELIISILERMDELRRLDEEF
jgi:DNA-binding CsgD family transcriptional regulator